MRILVDANLFLRAAQPSHPMFAAATLAMTELTKRGHELCCVPQVLYEFWVVATRPASVGGIGIEQAQAISEITKIRQSYTLLDDRAGILDAWTNLVERHNILGKLAHDARLIAAMSVHQIPALLTFNVGDFKRFPVTLIDPTVPPPTS